MDKDSARSFLRTFGDLPDELRHPCKHGHRECSTTHGGDCLDEAIDAGVVNIDKPNPQPTASAP